MPKIISKITVNKNVLSETLDQEEVLLNLKTKTYFGLNETGTYIWHHLNEGLRPQQIARGLVEKYGVRLDSAEEDVCNLIQELAKSSLVEID